MRKYVIHGLFLLTASLMLAGCQTRGENGDETEKEPEKATKTAAAPEQDMPASGSDTVTTADKMPQPRFITHMEDGRLWVLRPGQEKHEKHITMIGAGPGGTTIKAVDRDTALEYLAGKPGFAVEVEDGRICVLRPGQEKHEKHITMIGAGPGGTTLKAVDKETALEYLGAKPGFSVEVEDGRLWVLRPGQEKHEKHITMIGAGPRGMTIKALDKATALEYLAAKPGFEVQVEDGRLWVLRPGQEKHEKHVTKIGAGPMGATVKAPDRDTLEAYLAAD